MSETAEQSTSTPKEELILDIDRMAEASRKQKRELRVRWNESMHDIRPYMDAGAQKKGAGNGKLQ